MENNKHTTTTAESSLALASLVVFRPPHHHHFVCCLHQKSPPSPTNTSSFPFQFGRRLEIEEFRQPNNPVPLSALLGAADSSLQRLPREKMATDGSGAGGGGAGAGGPAPFLLKTYEMVEDPSTDGIVSWSAAKNSFVVWNPPEFARVLLPTYFKHNNFSSFIRQLNTYGFRKIDPERWEFANEDFVQGQKHLLKNIHRRKPIYSHSNPLSGADAERASLEEEIDRLTREKGAIQADLSRFKQQQSGTKLQLEDLDRRLQGMEQRQTKMMTFLCRAVHNPVFVEHLVQMAGAVPIDFSEAHKKRRLPGDGEGAIEGGQEAPDSGFHDNGSSNLKPDVCLLFRQDFSSKLKLELCPAISDSNLLSSSTQSSNEEGFSPSRRQLEGGLQLRQECLPILPEPMEVSDTGASCCPKKNTPFPWQGRNDEEGDRFVPCHLNLTLASSPLQLDGNLNSGGLRSSASHETGNTIELGKNNTSKEDDLGRISGQTRNSTADKNTTVSALKDANPSVGQAPPVAAAGRVNDKFWEQFLTERPGSSDIEEASSSLRTSSSAERPEEKKLEGEKLWRSRKDIQQLSL
ncbi:hypothetical protein Taro_028442 [Colocasia esculenta]|uniref:HSF-type DNA-binding domain-containing protein n=1 Tax=Colocasia esculenta TaxID=4460 RepID=A0A843VU55_COLES|nr:hypothetical protein [Colocasia esculenta]